MTAAGRTRAQEGTGAAVQSRRGAHPNPPSSGSHSWSLPLSPSGPESRVGAQKSPRAREASTPMRTGLLALDFFSKACLSPRKKSA